MNDNPLPGPKRETLLNLKAMMPSFIQGMAKKQAVGKGLPMMDRRPKKVCRICGLLYDYRMMKVSDETNIESQDCADCSQKLKDGYAAIVSGEKFAFVKSAGLKDWAGTIHRVSGYVMDSIQNYYNDQLPPSDAKSSSTNETN